MYSILRSTHFATALTIVLAFITDRNETLKYQSSWIPGRVARACSTADSQAPARTYFNRSKPQSPDTTAVILNWSRLPNVIQIVTLLCDSLLDHIIAEVVVWNNNPKPLHRKYFEKAQCAEGKLRIYNSPLNLYFHARFVACSQATTRYCFIQDDDYLVWPEVIKALHAHMSTTTSAGIHLLPSHERLVSDLRTIYVGSDIHTSFAWLGYGAIIHRTRAVDFLSLMGHLNVSDDELKMADNYFTILSNTFVDTWFDQGVELGGGQPFTVGAEGEERNNQYIMKATQMLQSAIDAHESRPFPYIKREPQLDPHLHRAPCLGSTCIFETSISLLPDQMRHTAPSVNQMLALEVANMVLMGEERITHYINYPPSHAVDGRLGTAFRSYGGAKQGDMVSLNIIREIGSKWLNVELVFLVDVATEEILRACTFEIALGERWIISNHTPSCTETGISSLYPSDLNFLRECSIKMLPIGDVYAGAHIFRARLMGAIEVPWCIYEVWLRGLPM